MKENKGKKKLVLILSCVGIILLIAGISFSLVDFIFKGHREHTIDLNGISFSYEEQAEGLSITNLKPLNDENGLLSGNDYTFKVFATSQTEREIPYHIYLTIDSENTLDSKYVRVNITNTTTNTSVGPINLDKLVLKENNDYYLMEDNFSFDGVTTELSNTYNLTIWVNEDYVKGNNYTVENNEQTTILGGETFNFKISVATGEMPKIQVDESNPNAPVLASNMIPVIYNDGNWVKADKWNTNLTWFNYLEKRWANAVTVTESNGSRDDLVDAEVGTVIPMDRINTMLVWIPRFSATGDTANYNGGTKEAPGAFNITFVNKDTTAHDAFDFGGAVSGFWIGKFENSSNETCSPKDNSEVGAGCNLTSIRPKVLPNASIWRGAMVSTFFYDILAMTENGNQYGFDKTVDTGIDTHMLKNNEWGAVAYLTQSIYGRCTSSTSCTEVGINNKSTYTTGYGAPAGSASTVTNGVYNTALGMNASTTGNIYGVYDMSGGALEYVMGNYNNTIKSDQFTTLPNAKYYNVYTTESDYTNAGLQHALTETKNWYGDYAFFVNSSFPWFGRGGYFNESSSAGVFYFYFSSGISSTYYGSRLSVTIN